MKALLGWIAGIVVFGFFIWGVYLASKEQTQQEAEYLQWRSQHCRLVRSDLRDSGGKYGSLTRVNCYSCDDGVERCDR